MRAHRSGAVGADAAAGALFILPRERVHPLDVPFTQAVKVISKWGAGAGELARGVKVRSRFRRVIAVLNAASSRDTRRLKDIAATP